jgi:polyisoprenoid-binding protein YceI
MVAKVRGTFETFSGSLTIAEDPLASKVEASIDLASINTRDAQRDGHLRSPDFFDTDTHPAMTFTSTSVAVDGDDYRVVGNLTLKGTTRPVELALEFNGVHPDPWGGTRAGFSAEAEISRKEFGVDFEVPMDGPGVVVGDKIKVLLEIEAVLQSADEAAEQPANA